jgi:hypothetical protein
MKREPIDDFWLAKDQRAPADSVVQSSADVASTIVSVWQHYRSGSPRVVLYDTSRAAAAGAMVAATAAGVDDLIPIAKRSAAGSLYSALVLSGPKLTVALDLTTTSCTSKLACYNYALTKYGDRVIYISI